MPSRTEPVTLWKPTEFRAHPVSFSAAMARGMWRGIVRHVYDGDSYAVFLDKGFFDYQLIDIRLKDVNAPEIVGEERAAGLAAKDFAIAHLMPARPVLIRVSMSTVDLERRSFERYIADVMGFNLAAGAAFDFAAELVAAGHATRVTG